ncbi:hypothetical protein R8Z50_12775 [Longispora sp. K20-0274]|uniref:hypothetical protein n=1 Tax=Longispora sp. K20-0274 TaxID=3088255 RepID=UPI00399AC727
MRAQQEAAGDGQQRRARHPAAHRLPPGDLVSLQALAGNQAVGRLVTGAHRPPIVPGPRPRSDPDRVPGEPPSAATPDHGDVSVVGDAELAPDRTAGTGTDPARPTPDPDRPVSPDEGARAEEPRAGTGADSTTSTEPGPGTRTGAAAATGPATSTGTATETAPGAGPGASAATGAEPAGTQAETGAATRAGAGGGGEEHAEAGHVEEAPDGTGPVEQIADPPPPAPLPAAEQLTAPPDPVPRPDHPASADLHDEILGHDDAGQAELGAALADTLAGHRADVDQQQARIGQLEAAELAAVGQAVATGRSRVAGAVASAQAAVRAAGTAQQSALAARTTAQQSEAAALVNEGVLRVRNSGTRRGADAVAAADQVAGGVRSTVDGLAGQATQRSATRAPGLRGESAESTAAMRQAAAEVASQTAEQIRGSLGTTEQDLRAAGPEVRGDLVRQAEQLATQIAARTEPLHRQLAQQATEASGSIGQAATAGATAVGEIGTSVSAGLTQLLRAVRSSVTQRAAAGRVSLRQAAQHTEDTLVQQGAQASVAGRRTTAQLLGQLTSRPVRRAFARELGGTMAATLREAYGMSAGRARALSGQIASEFDRAAAAVHESIQEAGRAGTAQAQQVAAGGVRQSGGIQQRVAGQLTTLMRQAAAQGDRVVEGTSQSVFQTAQAVDTGFVRAVADLRTRLEQHGRDAGTRAGEPLTGLDERMTRAADRAKERMEEGWLMSQLHDAWEALTPGFIAGLIVGLLVTIAIVAICGTGIGALILAGAVAGAASALASNATDYACGTGRYAGDHPWSWSEVGREMFFGAVFGAAGGALGAGVTGAIGSRAGSTILSGLARSTFSSVLTQQAATKVANVVVGVGMGIAQNVITEGLDRGWDHAFDHWDRGLLLNAAVGTVMASDAVGGRIHEVTMGARGAMVDAGMAYNVTPTEFNAASARMAERAGVELPTETAPPAATTGTTTETAPTETATTETGTTAPVETESTAAVATRDTPLTEPTVAEPVPGPERTPTQERVERATGVDRGPEHAAAMAELREFYENQQVEAGNVTEVSGTRIDQMTDAAGNPLTRPDGSPYGYGVEQGFEARRFDYGPGGGLTEVTIKVCLEGQPGVTPAQLEQMQHNTHAGVDQHYNNGQTLPNGDALHVRVEFVTDPADAHLTVAVEPGDGATVQNRWFANDNPTTIAHELGHQLGFLDEYIDAQTVNRGDATGPGVHTDGSLMGDFWLRDAAGNPVLDANGRPMVDPATQLHDRHLGQLGSDIDAARGTGTGGTGTPPAPAPGEHAVLPTEPAPAPPVEHAPSGTPPVEHEPAGAPPVVEDRAARIERRQAEAAANVAELDQRIAQITEEKQQQQQRIRDLNRELLDRGVDLRRVMTEEQVARLPEGEIRTLAETRLEVLDEGRHLSQESTRLAQERARWERAGSADIVRETYDQLRGRTPDDAARAVAAAAGTDITGRAGTEANPLQPDHVVPVMDIVNMDGFVMLSPEEQLAILNMPENFEPLNRAANASKSDWSWSEWPQWAEHATPELRAEMIARDADLRVEIQQRIDRALARARAGAR